MIDKKTLEKIYESKVTQVQVDGLNKCLQMFGITTKVQIAQFIAQVGVEQEKLLYKKELGGAAYFDKYDTGKIAQNLGNTPAKDGDGAKYKGRGYIQLTGLANYEQISSDLGIDFVNNPQLLETEEYAWYQAGWYWKTRNLNDCAHDVVKTTKKINGGTNHLEKRRALFERAKLILGC